MSALLIGEPLGALMLRQSSGVVGSACWAASGDGTTAMRRHSRFVVCRLWVGSVISGLKTAVVRVPSRVLSARDRGCTSLIGRRSGATDEKLMTAARQTPCIEAAGTNDRNRWILLKNSPGKSPTFAYVEGSVGGAHRHDGTAIWGTRQTVL